MEPLTDVREISRIAYGYMASQALFAALEIDLFTLLSRGAKSGEDIAAETGVAENRMETLLAGLVSLGLVTSDGGRFENSPASQTYLVKGAPADFGEYLRVVNGRMFYQGFSKLDAALRGERAFSDKGFYDGIFYQNQLDAKDFSAAQHMGSMGPATMLARRLPLQGARKLLDVAGGSGAFSITFCNANPGLEAAILDFPETVETARKFVGEAGLASRISHVEGNALTTVWPGKQDVVLMSYLWSAVGGDDIAELAGRAESALNPGGMIIVHDFMADNDRSGPPIAAWHLMGSMIDNPGAVCLTPEFVSDCLARAGFTGAQTMDLVPGTTRVATARKPD